MSQALRSHDAEAAQTTPYETLQAHGYRAPSAPVHDFERAAPPPPEAPQPSGLRPNELVLVKGEGGRWSLVPARAVPGLASDAAGQDPDDSPPRKLKRPGAELAAELRKRQARIVAALCLVTLPVAHC